MDNWNAIAHPDLLRMPDNTLRAFFGGIRSTSTGETNNAMNTATAPASGSPWTPSRDGRAGAVRLRDECDRCRSGRTNADLDLGGTPGSVPLRDRASQPDRTIPQSDCCLYGPEIAVDSANRQAWAGFHSWRAAARTVRERDRARRPAGGRKLAPGRSWQQHEGSGQPHVAHGTDRRARRLPLLRPGIPELRDGRLWKSTRRPQIVIRAAGNEHANVAASRRATVAHVR
jgi:hypothetical protein